MPTAVRRLDASTLADIASEYFREGGRTISWVEFSEAYGRRVDAHFAQRIVEFLPTVVTTLEARGVPCTLVNEFCVNHFREAPVTSAAEARRCNVFNSGGKPPVGIRRALPDDLVRSEVYGCQSKLGAGNIGSAVMQSVTDQAAGVLPPGSHDRLVQTLRGELPRLVDATPEARQALLIDPLDER